MHNILRAILSTSISAAGSLIWTKFISRLRRSQVLSSHQARKLMHITTAPLFLATLPLYPSHPISRFLAAAVPLSHAISILRAPKTNELVNAVARTGSKTDDAFATASYGISTAALVAVGWRASPATYIALAAMCFGDGFAGMIGSTVRSPKLPLTNGKTIAGSTSCFIATFLSSRIVLSLPQFPSISTTALCMSAFAASLVEALPIQDNITVPFTAFAFAKMFS
ncbi:putative phytol kinase 1, chloroplastic [Gracilariopsis chorda]|uniref:Putative phytol kinase 1, chloroplastic n=1 Tax=Gracilariopsis chorda TaxID=448386 RepID=A0A2V3IZ04_9FLOR|nr:putative phytol kinase 1, chloroplastic [Gracilariopsis chorda]|eukprot:PXF47329.1 putative phytol kinase 1, chloroplastic [Gracilariopsis chorda]